jgi:tRNA A37 threonylcarbamoyladenosine dehydratase
MRTLKPSSAYLQRFGGIARLYGDKALNHLFHSHVAVIGIGGVGSWVAESLARSGIGEISLIDMDDICITNSNRQIHALTSTVGQQKIDIMSARLQDINPELRINAVDNFIDKDNLSELINPSMNMVIDAFDAANTKAALINHCKRNKQPIITIGSAGGKINPQKIVHGDLSKTINDPLLSKVRNTLRRKHGFARESKRTFSIEAIYSAEQTTYPTSDGGTCKSRPETYSVGGLDCNNGFGAATMVTASFGLIATSRAIDKILKKIK